MLDDWKSAPSDHDGVEGAAFVVRPSPSPLLARDIAAFADTAVVLTASAAVTVPGCRGGSGGINFGGRERGRKDPLSPCAVLGDR
jgi:hypothetical protein